MTPANDNMPFKPIDCFTTTAVLVQPDAPARIVAVAFFMPQVEQWAHLIPANDRARLSSSLVRYWTRTGQDERVKRYINEIPSVRKPRRKR